VPHSFGVYQVEMPPLPPQPAGQINLPAAPQIPPTRVDIAEAIEYIPLAPAWFAPIRAQLNRIERGVNVVS
jgi:hypothetical protein